MKWKEIGFIALCVVSLLLSAYLVEVSAWSNGGYSSDPSNPDYGTHDWIAQHALDWLPLSEKQYIVNNLATYLYGTELPDNGQAPDGIGDTINHHFYYNSAEAVTDDSAAVRASTVYAQALNYLKSEDSASAAKYAGIMSHYIVDLAVFGHVMSSGTDWGAETHHGDYESYVNQRTSTYSAEFNVYLSFDGNLRIISAYEATKELAYDTTFDADGDLTCLWMDHNYDWNNPTFKNRCGESLNLAVNYLADVLHTLSQPTIDIYADKSSYKLGETARISGRIVNPGPAIDLKVKAWAQLPDGSVMNIMDKVTTIPANGDITRTYKYMFPPHAQKGAYTLRAQLIDPSTQQIISEDTATFTLS